MTTTDALASIGAADPHQAIADGIASLDAQMAPVPRDPAERAGWVAAMDERLRRLAVKIAPGMSVEQGKTWRDVMSDALADLPAMVALTAAKRAIHKPMRFLNEVEGTVRELAVEVVAERRAAKVRLEKLEREIRSAAQPKISGRTTAAPLTVEEIRRMAPEYRRMGLSLGEITQEQIEEADALNAQAKQEAA